jgi:hypothetical protein
MAPTVVGRSGAAAYPDRVNPRARRLIVSGVLVLLVVIVLLTALRDRLP